MVNRHGLEGWLLTFSYVGHRRNVGNVNGSYGAASAT
jgi:hypothetical protein